MPQPSRRAAGGLLLGGLLSSAAPAQDSQTMTVRTTSEGAPILSFHGQVPVGDGIWAADISPDRRHVAALTNYTGPVLVEVATGRRTRVPVEAFNGIKYVVWSRDGRQVAFTRRAGDAPLLVASPDAPADARLIAVRGLPSDLPNGLPGGLPGFDNACAMFSADGRYLYASSGSSNPAVGLAVAIDLETGAVSPRVPVPPGPPPYNDVGTKFGKDAVQHLAGRSVFSVVLQTQIGRHVTGIGGNIFRYDAASFTLEGEGGPPPPAPMPLSEGDGVDLLDDTRPDRVRVPVQVLFSGALDRWVIYSTFYVNGPDGRRLPESVERWGETYDPRTHARLSRFGGSDTVEQGEFQKFLVHGTQPWAITSAHRVTGHGFREAAVLTVWDLRDGSALQRLWLPDGPTIGLPQISPDGRTLSASLGTSLLILDIAAPPR